MSYRILDIEVTHPLPSVSLSAHEKGIAVLLRKQGKPIAFWMEASTGSPMISDIDLAGKISDKARDKIIGESIREELIKYQKPSQFPSLTIAICTKDRTHQLARCLNSVKAVNALVSGVHVAIETIVVDNAPSDDQTQKLVAKFPGVKYFCEIKPGLNFARNRALKEANGELLAFLDDDVTVDRFWLDGLMEAWSENPEAGAFTGLVLPYELTTRAQILFEERGGWRKSFERIVYGHSLPGNSLYPSGAGMFGTGANMAFRKDALLETGGFDEALDTGPPLPGGGDLDIFYRIIRGGYLLVYDPKYMVFHEHRRAVHQLCRQYMTWGLCFMAFVAKSIKTDPSQYLKFRKLIVLWFRSHLRLLRRSITGRSKIPPYMYAAEIWGAAVGLSGEYSRSKKRIDKINKQFQQSIHTWYSPVYAYDRKPETTHMSSFRPWHIMHIDLSKGIPQLSNQSGIKGVYSIFWWHDIPLGETRILATDLPLTTSQVTQMALKSITPSVRDYLLAEEYKTQIQVSSGGSPQAKTSDFSNIKKIARPLEMIRNTHSMEGSFDIPVSVVICTRDRPESLKRCLHSLSALSRSPLEILVVDNAPGSDETRAVVNSIPGIRYIPEPQPGLDIARNSGVLHSSGDIIAFIDDDVVVHPQWLLSLQRAFQNQQVMATTGLVLPAELETEAQYMFETHWGFNRGYRPITYDTKYFNRTRHTGSPVWDIGAGANMAFRRRAFDLVGLFDERLDVGAAGCSGDSEFWYRVLAEGCSCRYEPSSVVYHYHRRDWHSYKHQIFYYMRGHVCALLIQFERYTHWGNLRRLLLSLPRYYLNLIRKGIFRGLDSRLRTIVPEIAGCLSGVWFYLRMRRQYKGPYHDRNVLYLESHRNPSYDLPGHESKSPEASLVTVVIPCYNQADFLGEAIQSVIKQTYPHIEIIVVDDGSTDHTPDVALGFPDVQYIRQDNQGLSGARNKGLRESKGHYIVFLDADDRLMTSAVESGVHCFREHPDCVFVSGTHTYIKSDGSSFDYMATEQSEQHRFLARLRNDKDHYRALLCGNHIGMHATVMYRRSIFVSVGEFDTSLKACEDYELYLRITRNHPIFCHDRVVAEYRLHSANMTGNPELMLRNALRVLRSQRKIIKSHAEYLDAYRTGKLFWIDYYAHDLIKQIKSQLLTSSKRTHALRGLLTMLRYAPAWFFKFIVNHVQQFIKRTLKSLFPLSALRLLRLHQGSSEHIPPPGHVLFGDLRRLTPLSYDHGSGKGSSIDLFYIERFLANNSADIRGSVLEAGSDFYTKQYGSTGIEKSDVLHLNGAVFSINNNITDLTGENDVPGNKYDCIILPQVLHCVYEVKKTLQTIYGTLKPGGVLLATVPGTSSNMTHKPNRKPLWAFTAQSAQRLLGEVFPASNIAVKTDGNVFMAAAFMHRLTAHDLKTGEMEHTDPLYQVIITIRALKPHII